MAASSSSRSELKEMAENLRNSALSGVIWGFVEKFALQIFGFIQGIILARLLVPSDYGLLAMVNIFVMLSYTLIDSGFSTALIQKNNRTETDYSTVFIVNVFMSALLSITLALCAPLIANFYHEPILIKVVYANALLLFLGSFIAVQDVRLSINLQFKKRSAISMITTIISGVFSIVLAFMGYGMWSLVYPLFLTIFLKYILYWYYQRWMPKFRFSKQSFRELFGFGSKMLASSILATIFDNLYPIIIGKRFSAKDLGYYSRADGYANLPSKTITSVIETVSFPVLSKMQDNEESLMGAFRRMLRVSAFLIFPIMIWMAVLAKPLVIVLVTEKWLPCVLYLQILCFSKMWWHVHVLNLQLLKVKGRSDLFFNLEVIKKILTVIILVITVPFGILAMCLGSFFASLISMCINSFYTGKLFNMGIVQQMKEMLPSLLYALSMGLVLFFISQFFNNYYLQLFVPTAIGFAYYFIIAKISKSNDLAYLMILIKEKFRKEKPI